MGRPFERHLASDGRSHTGITAIGASNIQLVWASKPGCSKPVAEFWVGENRERFLWFVLFIDDDDRKLRIELLPPLARDVTLNVDLTEAEVMIGRAKRELLAMLDLPH